MSVAFALSLVAGCVAGDQTDLTTDTSSQDLTVSSTSVLYCQPVDGGICITQWTPDFTAPGAYWAGHGTANPAKVMAIFYVPTKADPTTGLATAYYAWMMAGYDPTCTYNSDGIYSCSPNNQAFRLYEIQAGQLPSFQQAARLNFNLHENQNPLNANWDGGAGGGLSGSPVHPGGPGGLPGATVLAMQNAMGAFRNFYVNVYNITARGTGG